MAKKIEVQKLKPIKNNIGIERQLEKQLREFSKQVNKSLFYRLNAVVNKGVGNVSTQLKFKFNELSDFWEKKATEYAFKLTNKLNKQVENYVDNNLKKQNESFFIKGKSKELKEIENAILNRQISLIKSIPAEAIERYKNVFYNAVGNFDREAIKKQALTISGISNRRAKTIARDQVAKAINEYQMGRSKQLGFEYYEWSTSNDERVSTGKGGHKQLNGRIYRYDTPTAIIDSYGNKGHCSDRVNCRCVPIPVMLQANQDVKLIRDSQNGDYYKIIEKKL